MRVPLLSIAAVAASLLAGGVLVAKNLEPHAANHILNVSYDPTRELYLAIDPAFIAESARGGGEEVDIRQSHGGSSYQARQVASGAQAADVVTLGLPSDIDGLAKRGLIAAGWRTRLPNNAQPYHTTVVFVVRKGNPLHIGDWPDLVKGNIEVITPDPKTSGNGKLTLLAAWGSVISKGGSEADAKTLITAILDHAPFLVPAARAASVAFSVEKRGDVQVAWENEALREVAESKGAVEIVYPPVSILAEPAVAWVDANVAKHHSEALAKSYLEFLFGDAGQEIIAKEGYRAFNPDVAKRHADRLPEVNLFPISLIAKDWNDADQKFFAENGVIDAIYKPKPRTD